MRSRLRGQISNADAGMSGAVIRGGDQFNALEARVLRIAMELRSVRPLLPLALPRHLKTPW